MELSFENMTNEELAVLAKTDRNAFDPLIRKNEGFIIYMVTHFLNRSGFYDHQGSGLTEDYAQICRLSIVKAVKNYKADSGVKFVTYAGKIMYHSMLRQMEKDREFREEVTGVFTEEVDTTLEECDEEYGDDYDSRFENENSMDINILPSSLAYSHHNTLIELNEKGDAEYVFSRFNAYFTGMSMSDDTESEDPGTDKSEPAKTKASDQKNNKEKFKYGDCVETNYSWKYPIYHKAIHNLQIETIMNELYDDSFDAGQRMYLEYRFGLKNLIPVKIKEAAEHFNLSVSYARKYEKDGLAVIKKSLEQKHLLY